MSDTLTSLVDVLEGLIGRIEALEDDGEPPDDDASEVAAWDALDDDAARAEAEDLPDDRDEPPDDPDNAEAKGYNPAQPRDAHGRFGQSALGKARATLKDAHKVERIETRSKHQEARAALKEKHAGERAGVTGRTARSELAAQHASERGSLKDKHASERSTLQERHKGERAQLAPKTNPQGEGRNAGDPIVEKPAHTSTTRAFGNDPNTVYEFKTRVVSMDDLIVSNTDHGGINPHYDPSLQPRQRDRAASQEQIDRVARTMNPEALVTDFHQIDRGAPIIGSDHMVESGNGRTLALRRAREHYPEQYEAYKTHLRDNLAQHGLTEADLHGVKDPVLVRERITHVADRAKFATEANNPPVLQMSPIETARRDARGITDHSLTNLHVGEDQSIDLALRSPKNHGFVTDFMSTLEPNERATMMRADGTLNRAGITRMKAAIYKKTFPGTAGDRLTDTFTEALDNDIKNYESGIAGSLPRLSHTEALMSSGARDHRLSLTGDMAHSLDVLSRLREQGIPVKNYLARNNMFGDELNHDQRRLLTHFDGIGKSQKKIRAFMHRYADLVEGSADPRQGGHDMFGNSTHMSKGELLDHLLAGGDGE